MSAQTCHAHAALVPLLGAWMACCRSSPAPSRPLFLRSLTITAGGHGGGPTSLSTACVLLMLD